MGKVTYEYPIADICGKIGKNATMGFAHRGDTKYTVKYGTRTTPVTPAETQQRNKFKTAVTATRARMQDPEKYAQDLAKFQAQTRYKTLYQYVFNDEMGKLA